MGECGRNSKRMARDSEEAETMENSSSTSSVSKRMRLIGMGLADNETSSSYPSALPPAADEEEEVKELNSGEAAGISTLEESSSRFCSSNMSGEFLDLEDEARSFDTDSSTSCVANNKLSRERVIAESSELSSICCTGEKMKLQPEGEPKLLARGRYEPPPSPIPKRVKIQKPSPALRTKVLRLSPAQLEQFFGGFWREQCKDFEEKYNFDFVNEVPKDGRYEWVRLKPDQEPEQERV